MRQVLQRTLHTPLLQLPRAGTVCKSHCDRSFDYVQAFLSTNTRCGCDVWCSGAPSLIRRMHMHMHGCPVAPRQHAHMPTCTAATVKWLQRSGGNGQRKSFSTSSASSSASGAVASDPKSNVWLNVPIIPALSLAPCLDANLSVLTTIQEIR